jgi:hypothetical protein
MEPDSLASLDAIDSSCEINKHTRIARLAYAKHRDVLTDDAWLKRYEEKEKKEHIIGGRVEGASVESDSATTEEKTGLSWMSS